MRQSHEMVLTLARFAYLAGKIKKAASRDAAEWFDLENM